MYYMSDSLCLLFIPEFFVLFILMQDMKIRSFAFAFVFNDI